VLQKQSNDAMVKGIVGRRSSKASGAVETSTHTGLRGRALHGALAYTFARIGAVVNLKVEDYYPSGKRLICRRVAQIRVEPR
jgi:hypothetical protein